MMDRIPESYMYWMTSKKVTDDDMEAIEDENVFNIVMFVKWGLSISIFSQIWQYSK
jgi:hypothetical protein